MLLTERVSVRCDTLALTDVLVLVQDAEDARDARDARDGAGVHIAQEGDEA